MAGIGNLEPFTTENFWSLKLLEKTNYEQYIVYI